MPSRLRSLRASLRGLLPARRSPGRIFNEAVNFERQAIFIAIPKTGTTTIRLQLAQPGQPMIPAPHLDILQVRDGLYAHLLLEGLRRNKGFPTAGVPTDAEVRARAAQVFRAFFKFSIVRNPWARAVSMYFRREGVQVRERMSFEAFCDQHLYASDTCAIPTLHRNQVDWLCDEHGTSLMDFTFKLEEYDQGLRELAERTGGRLQLLSNKANANPESGASRYRELYTDRTRQLIATRFEKDIDTFKYTF